MDSRTGELYESKTEALDAGVPEENIIELSGADRDIKMVSDAVKAARKKARRRVKLSRRANRK